MRSSLSHFIKSAIVTFMLLASGYMFTVAIRVPIEVAQNYKQLLRGEYVVPAVSDSLLYTFTAYSISMNEE